MEEFSSESEPESGNFIYLFFPPLSFPISTPIHEGGREGGRGREGVKLGLFLMVHEKNLTWIFMNKKLVVSLSFQSEKN